MLETDSGCSTSQGLGAGLQALRGDGAQALLDEWGEGGGGGWEGGGRWGWGFEARTLSVLGAGASGWRWWRGTRGVPLARGLELLCRLFGETERRPCWVSGGRREGFEARTLYALGAGSSGWRWWRETRGVLPARGLELLCRLFGETERRPCWVSGVKEGGERGVRAGGR